MDGRARTRASGDAADAAAAAVIVVENEAESVPVQERRNYLDTCPVCHLSFRSREPRLLPCLHSFCGKCLPAASRNLAVAEPPSSRSDGAAKPLNVIRCPVCRQECMEVDVMENVFVKDPAEAPSSTVERTVQLCMTCDDNTEATGFCVDCVEYLCVTCVDAHQRVKFTKDHTIREKTLAAPEACGVSTQRPLFCDTHKKEPLKLFCETCDVLTCRDCQLLKHKDHNYQFLEDAYKSHKQHMENMTHQLQEKKKVIDEVSNSINSGLVQVDQNRTSVHNEIKKSICSLILEINKKGKMLINQLEAVTKDHESILRKQQEDIGYLSRHLDHVISFTRWATARSGGTALLHCKRLILFQIGNLLRAKCSTSFIPQSTVRFQCRSAYWASNVDLGSLVVESVPGHQLSGFQGIPHQLPHPGRGPSGSPHSFASAAAHSTLAQLQMQVDKLNPQAHWQPPPHPPPWTWYQSVRLQRTVPGPLQGGSPSHGMLPQPGRRFMVPPPNHVSPTSSLPSPGFTPQPLRAVGGSSSYQPKPASVFSSPPSYNRVTPVAVNCSASAAQSQQAIESAFMSGTNDSPGPVYLLKPNYWQSLPSHRSVQGQQVSPEYAAVSQEEKPGSVSWKPSDEQAREEAGLAVKKRRRSSPGPIIIIKDEPEDASSYVQAHQRANLPDSTGDQLQISPQGEGSKVLFQSADDKPHSPSRPPGSPRDQSEAEAPNDICSLGGDPPGDRRPGVERSDGVCAACRSGGELLRCNKCHRVFHLTCHVPTLHKCPCGEWFCSLCRDLLVPELEYDCDRKPEANAVKTEPETEGGFTPVDKRKCERLLLHLFCSELGSDPQEPPPPSVGANNAPMNLVTVKRRLEAKQSLCYQSTAQFAADIRLIFENRERAEAEVAPAGRKPTEVFEEHLRTLFPDQTAPEIKLELPPAAPSLDKTSQVKR
ncbi:transcription intermediary factor 1-alpha-like isoform X2 [Betta splendens]|uniref:Transcription intermediary factor 1-alpha-like isoform X2 n=1 Tax=Betta splendens TaxID=158456 RepID=A0A6P7MWE8_BETSP|nr:transcription intermediary factor 1-alpha-like isoform X2 [Betta splendens]